MEGTRPLTGPALPNLINAVSMLKSTSKSKSKSTCLSRRKPKFSAPTSSTPMRFWL